jgi:hypothetical protein
MDTEEERPQVACAQQWEEWLCNISLIYKLFIENIFCVVVVDSFNTVHSLALRRVTFKEVSFSPSTTPQRS